MYRRIQHLIPYMDMICGWTFLLQAFRIVKLNNKHKKKYSLARFKLYLLFSSRLNMRELLRSRYERSSKWDKLKKIYARVAFRVNN